MLSVLENQSYCKTNEKIYNCKLPEVSSYRFLYSLRLFRTTLTDEQAMSALAHTGVSCKRTQKRLRAPAATGIQMILYINGIN